MKKNTERIAESTLRDIRKNSTMGSPEFTDDEINAKSNRELLNHWLQWNGIIGYTGTIISVIENIYDVELDNANCNSVKEQRDELRAALEAQEAASESKSMAIHYQDSEENAKTYEQKKCAHDNYLAEATKYDLLQDKATELRRAAIAKCKGE